MKTYNTFEELMADTLKSIHAPMPGLMTMKDVLFNDKLNECGAFRRWDADRGMA